jgi:Streptomyces sporulation and cell division protein, SsgA
MNAPDLVTTELSLQLVVPGGAALPVSSDFRYDCADPYAIHIGFRTGEDEIVEWTFARQLLADGVTHPVGEGDVQVWPSSDDGSHAVCLSLCSPSGSALFEMPLSGLVEFLTRTYTAVPTGSEGDFVDLDAELALLVWTDPQG